MVWVLGIVAAVLFFRNYQLEKKWRVIRYCWQSMSDLCVLLTEHDERSYNRWGDGVVEQSQLLSRFNVRPLTTAEIRIYEQALLERKIGILTAHKGL